MAQNYYTDIDMHNNKIINLPDATSPQQPVTLHQSIKKNTTTIGDGTNTSYTVTHGLGTQDVTVQVRQMASPYSFISPSQIQATDNNSVAISFATAPTNNQYKVIILG